MVTTLTKRMAEELTRYLGDLDIKAKYIHSDIAALDRVDILRELREGKFHVLVGVNLLREGLDLPEVAWLPFWMQTRKVSFVRAKP